MVKASDIFDCMIKRVYSYLQNIQSSCSKQPQEHPSAPCRRGSYPVFFFSIFLNAIKSSSTNSINEKHSLGCPGTLPRDSTPSLMRLPSALPLEELDKAGYWFRREGDERGGGSAIQRGPLGVCDPKGAESLGNGPGNGPGSKPSFQSHFVFTSATAGKKV